MTKREFNTLADIVNTFPERGTDDAIRFFNGFRIFHTSYAQLYEQALRFAGYLRSIGVERGDRILIWTPNSPEWAMVYCGCVISGVVLVPIDARHTPEFIQHVARETQAKLLVRSQFSADPTIDAPTVLTETLFQKVESAQPHTQDAPIQPDDVAQILYTSGTTGDPKGVVLTQRNQAVNVSDILAHIPVDASYHALSVLPLSHALEQTAGFWTVLAAGGSVLYLKTLKPSALAQVFQRETITVMVLVPRLLDMFKQRIEEQLEAKGVAGIFRLAIRCANILPRWTRKLLFRFIHKRFNTRFHAFVSGGSALAPDVERFWLGLGFQIWQGYGLTETSPVLTAAQPNARRVGSVGLPVSNVEIQLGEGKEILARGPNVFGGYYQKPHETEKVFRDGWFRTGDVGEIDDNGFLYIRTRLKDVIVTADGINIYPEDIENVLNQVEGVIESCVIGVGEREEEIHAVLLLNENAGSAEAAVKSANAQLPPEQRIQEFSVWPEPEFPKTPTLKIKKKEVKSQITQPKGAAPPSAKGTALQRILCELSNLALDEIQPESKLGDDLGLSSIDRVELAAQLEAEFRTDVDERALTPETTVRELEALLHSSNQAQPLHIRRWTLTQPTRAFRWLFQNSVVRPAIGLFCDLHCSGLENLKDVKGPVFFVSNHTSHIDTALIQLLTPAHLGAKACPAAWAEYFITDGLGFLTRLAVWSAWNISTIGFNIFPFSNTGAFRQSMAYAGELVDKGWSILLFPEGTRTLDGNLNEFKDGAGILAHNLQVPIVPVATFGAHKVLPTGAGWPKRNRVDIVFGKPFQPGDASIQEINLRIQQEIVMLWEQINNGNKRG
ncbi:MAG: AMP-binding protein [Candidatus Hinthialibacter antarcticus]|nr:AMP-binding protein [Candidatus Hinthialibacter antarcticus]